MNCIRCGALAHQYGSDGLPYCDSCSFYGMNKQCWKCRMYIPSSELQQSKGQWICPVCLNDERSQESARQQYKPEKYKPEQYVINQDFVKERCEKCGRDLEVVYVYKKKKYCQFCADIESGDLSSPDVHKFRLKKKKGIVKKIIEFFRKPKDKTWYGDQESVPKGDQVDKDEIRSADVKEVTKVKESQEKTTPFQDKIPKKEVILSPLVDKQKTKKEVFSEFKKLDENYKLTGTNKKEKSKKPRKDRSKAKKEDTV